MTDAGDDWVPLSRLVLDTARDRVAAFAAALAAGAPASGANDPARLEVPATFAATLLADPAVTGPLTAMAEARGAALVHQAQDFRYLAPLGLDQAYAVDLDWQHPSGREDRITVRGRIRSPDGELLQVFRTDIVFFESRRRSLDAAT